MNVECKNWLSFCLAQLSKSLMSAEFEYCGMKKYFNMLVLGLYFLCLEFYKLEV